MTDHPLQRQWLRRRQRLRRLLRLLPRRTNVGRYPVISRFANAAKGRPYLWSFRREHVLPAVYVGTVLAFMPTYGVQVLLGLFAAIAVRANLTVMVGLQMIANPLTAAPIYLVTHELGHRLIDWTGYGRLESGFGTSVNALILGGLVAGLAVAFMIDLTWRAVAWESRRFTSRYRAWRATHEIQADAEQPDAL